MTLTLQSAAALLGEHDLLREIITPDRWSDFASTIPDSDVPFAHITYDSKQIEPHTLMCCKGNFKAEYLDGADGRGMAAYVAEHDYSGVTRAPGLIVDDASKALSLLSQAFYDYPERELKLIGVTGTKGKTTTSYFTHAIINAMSGNKCALFSSVDNCVDGVHYVESDLTTPESLDAARMMREAVDNGMRYLVMEVSSQAYKVNRVYGLTFDAAAFLNISPDHISPIEHPSFEDYLHCKRQIVRNTHALVLGVPGDYANLVAEDATIANVPVTTFSIDEATADVTAQPVDDTHTTFLFTQGQPIGELSLALEGDFNYANACAALALAQIVGIDIHDPRALQSMADVRIAGRMEETRDPQSDTVAIVDYAHNYASVNALLDFVERKYGARRPRITLLTGSAGDKALDRRREIIEAAQDRVQRIMLTTEDTNTEDPMAIAEEMLGYVTNPDVDASIIIDRAGAVEDVVAEAREHDGFDVLLLIGKGDERWIKMHNRHVPYEGDSSIIRRLFS